MTALFPGTRIQRPKREEDALQRQQVEYLERLRAQNRLEYYAIPNGGQRAKAEAAIVKGLGVRAGVPDLCILWRTPAGPGYSTPQLAPQCGYIENKSPIGRTSDAQKEWAGWLTSNGHRYALVNSWAGFMETLYTWGLISGREVGL